MIQVRVKGSYSKTRKFLQNGKDLKVEKILRKYAEQGVTALSKATPVDTGKTASSWDYSIESTKNGVYIYWNNSNINHGVKIALLIQYGHATRNGGWVQGIDYINPALRPIMDKIADEAWKEVNKSGN